tara:strand:- start:119 stop:298 length:180 start_codon:yes stop_codon:yes gene_type:complete
VNIFGSISLAGLVISKGGQTYYVWVFLVIVSEVLKWSVTNALSVHSRIELLANDLSKFF